MSQRSKYSFVTHFITDKKLKIFKLLNYLVIEWRLPLMIFILNLFIFMKEITVFCLISNIIKSTYYAVTL